MRSSKRETGNQRTEIREQKSEREGNAARQDVRIRGGLNRIGERPPTLLGRMSRRRHLIGPGRLNVFARRREGCISYFGMAASGMSNSTESTKVILGGGPDFFPRAALPETYSK